ncbi:MAG: hypothetical protein ABJG88_08405 [Litorimonas sp.]
MRYILIALTALLATLLLSACATSSNTEPSASKTAKADKSSAQKPRNGAEVKTRLSARSLSRDDCGLFVWSADDERRFILFSQSQDNGAVWAGPNGETRLVITEVSGQEFQQQFTQQSLTEEVTSQDGDNTISSTLLLSLRQIEELTWSTRFKAGTLSHMTDDGAERIIPVVGLSTCRT